MELTLFAKKRTTREGKSFYTYLTKLTRKDGTEVTTAVKFRDNGMTLPRPEDCPCNIIVEKKDANFSTRTLVNDTTGEMIQSNTLWVSAWIKGAEYIDNSMDDFV